MALGYALATTTLFQSILKILIGGLRPHFLDVCQPPQIPAFPGQGYRNIWRTPADVCTGNPKRIREAQMSFPSGHSAAAFAGFGVLALYLNAKFKILGNHKHENIEHLEQTALPQTNADTQTASIKEKTGSKEHMKSSQTPHWKMLMFVTPWLIASALGMSKVADYWHHPIDVLAGALLGTVMAHMAYRMTYKGVYDSRVNHIPREK
jgi:diacylglycerol diphosphate phosphatase/phosphatidate phosphatase